MIYHGPSDEEELAGRSVPWSRVESPISFLPLPPLESFMLIGIAAKWAEKNDDNLFHALGPSPGRNRNPKSTCLRHAFSMHGRVTAGIVFEECDQVKFRAGSRGTAAAHKRSRLRRDRLGDDRSDQRSLAGDICVWPQRYPVFENKRLRREVRRHSVRRLSIQMEFTKRLLCCSSVSHLR